MKLKKFRFIFLLNAFVLAGCSLFANSKVPYVIDAEMILDESSEYEIAGLNFDFYNKEAKTVNQFTMVFYLCDWNGNPVSMGRSNVVLTVNVEVLSKERIQGCISLDDFLYDFPDERYQVDYLYVSKIKYEDGSEWSDPFGLLAF